jgi:CheY-like chemotaxis protein
MSLKIMAIDDEPLSLKVMRSLAVPLGHTVLTLDNGGKAQQEVEKRRFDVVFVGLSQPDALELTRQIRTSEFGGETAVVMLTVTDDIDILRKAYNAGVMFVIPKPITAARIIPMLTAMDSPGWKAKIRASRLPLFTEVKCKCGDQDLLMRSMNISETGMLLQSSHNVEVGQEVSLGFKIAEVGISLNVSARIVRREGTERMGIEFIGLMPEEKNAIQLYVMGRLSKSTPSRGLSDTRMHRLINP